jgi:hypothetical protein
MMQVITKNSLTTSLLAVNNGDNPVVNNSIIMGGCPVLFIADPVNSHATILLLITTRQHNKSE